MKMPIFKRYFKFFALILIIGAFIISAFSLIKFKVSYDYNRETLNYLSNIENKDSLKFQFSNCSDDAHLVVSYIYDPTKSDYFNFDNTYAESILSLGLFISIITCLIFNIYAFNDENKIFLKVLPIKREYIYLLRVLLSFLIAVLLFLISSLWAILICKYNYSALNSILNIFDSDYTCHFYLDKTRNDTIYHLFYIILFSTAMPFLNTLLSKPVWAWIIGIIAANVINYGVYGIFSFSEFYHIISSDYTFNFYRFISVYILNRITLSVISLILVILGTFTYKIANQENRKAFFMFKFVKFLSFFFGTVLGGFAFYTLANSFCDFNYNIINNLVFGLFIVFCGFVISYYIIKKAVEICE